MKLPIYLYGHPVLRKVSEPITAVDDQLKSLLENMFETMYNSDGIGLAAPQIGINKRIVVIDGSVLAEDFPECADSKMAILNPEIEVLDGEEVSRGEGCLSLPGIAEDVKRVEHLRLRWQDENLEHHEREFSGFMARIIQHECDHLDGKVFIDHISAARKLFIKRKLSNIVEGKTRVEYPAKYAPRR